MLKKTISLLILAITLGVALPIAAEIYVKPKSQTTQAPQEEVEPPAPALQEAEPVTPPIEGTIEATDNKAFANEYYKNCMAQDHAVLKGNDKEMLCSCTSAQLTEHFTQEQMQTSMEDSEDGAFQRARLALNVYTPCIEYPTNALVTDNCLSNPQVQAGIPNYQAVCGCVGDKMGAFMKIKAPAYMRSALAENPEDLDPLRVLLESDLYNDNTQGFLNACIKEHAL